jgi:RNA polymerase sigma-70 factor, ECF subfamily
MRREVHSVVRSKPVPEVRASVRRVACGAEPRSLAALATEPVRRSLPAVAEAAPVLYFTRPRLAESILQFCSFDAGYIESLCAGDRGTQEHFVSYFTALLKLKLRSRLNSPQAIEDVRQETFARVFKALRKPGTLRQPDRLGAFVNTVCNNVLLEHYRASSRSQTVNQSIDEEGHPELASTDADALDIASSNQIKVKVRQVLLEMPMRDRMLLKAVFLDERDRGEVCDEFGVDREYLRVLLYRAKQDFKAEYLKRVGNHVPAGLDS